MKFVFGTKYDLFLDIPLVTAFEEFIFMNYKFEYLWQL